MPRLLLYSLQDVCSLADTPQLLFLSGVALVIGLQKTFNLFFQIRKLRGTIPFFFGIGLVLIGWTKIGILVEGFGFVNLFGYYLHICFFNVPLSVCCCRASR